MFQTIWYTFLRIYIGTIQLLYSLKHCATREDTIRVLARKCRIFKKEFQPKINFLFLQIKRICYMLFVYKGLLIIYLISEEERSYNMYYNKTRYFHNSSFLFQSLIHVFSPFYFHSILFFFLILFYYQENYENFK